MNMPKSRDIQAKIPLPQAIWNEFGYVTVNGVNSNVATGIAIYFFTENHLYFDPEVIQCITADTITYRKMRLFSSQRAGVICIYSNMRFL